MILFQIALEWLSTVAAEAHVASSLLPSHGVTRHCVEVVIASLMIFLASPDAPREEGKATKQDGTANTTDHASNDRFGVG